MCSVQEDGTLLPKMQDVNISKRCKKCEKPAFTIIHGNDSMCRECFDGYCVHKFRSSFGKHHVIRDGESVLVGFSGGLSSCAMAQLIVGGLSKRAQKKLRFIPTVVYVDECSALGFDQQKRLEVIKQMITLMRKTEIPFKVYFLEQAYTDNLNSQFDDSSSEMEPGVILEKLAAFSNQTKKIQEIFDQCKALDAKSNLLRLLRLSLLEQIALKPPISKVLLGDSSTRLSIRMISDVTQGKGAHLPYIMNFADGRHKQLIFVRPMRELSAKEIAMYNRLNNVATYFIPNFLTMAPNSKSLELTSERFALKMQNENCSALPKIFRTGEKLDVDSSFKEEMICSFCHAPLDTDKGIGSALDAIELSRRICLDEKKSSDNVSHQLTSTANQISPLSATANEKCSKGPDSDTCCQTKENRCCSETAQEGDGALTLEGLKSTLCYACQTIADQMRSPSHLPPAMYNDALTLSNRMKQRETIAEYLLSDSDDE